MHAKEVELLKRRAKGFLRAAKSSLKDGDYDLACFMAEQSAQLYLKAVILEISGEMPRTHSIRSLLSILSTLLKKQVKYDRKSLIFLESAYINARYLGVVYEKEDAEEAVRIAEGIMELVDRIRKEEG